MWLQRGGGIAEESCTGAVRGTPAATCWDTKQEGGRECGVRCAGGGGGEHGKRSSVSPQLRPAAWSVPLAAHAPSAAGVPQVLTCRSAPSSSPIWSTPLAARS